MLSRRTVNFRLSDKRGKQQERFVVKHINLLFRDVWLSTDVHYVYAYFSVIVAMLYCVSESLDGFRVGQDIYLKFDALNLTSVLSNTY